MERVQLPALSSATLSESAKAKVRSSNTWLTKFQRVGDLLRYLRRFDSDAADPLYVELKQHGLLTFEDIAADFENKFKPWAADCSRATDFVIGKSYGAHQLLIFCNTYDTRAGGMFVLRANGRPTAVLVKANLNGGSYANEWLDLGLRLKYYLKAINGVFGEHFAPNRAILEIPSIPILTFVRSAEGEEFTYFGVFELKRISRELDKSKWFELSRAHEQPDDVIVKFEYVAMDLSQRVLQSSKLTRLERLNRLKGAPTKPRPVLLEVPSFYRNADVIAEVLHLAAGLCGGCGKPAPFQRKDGTPYLEVHHIIRLADGGDDTVENATALCPNCHRCRHFGPSIQSNMVESEYGSSTS